MATEAGADQRANRDLVERGSGVDGRPLVSILVPIHNGAQYLRQALDSINRQSYDNIEVLLIDDGSDDASPTLIDEFCRATRYPVKRARHHTVAGAVNTHNELVTRASGQWLKFLHQDDVLEDGAIQEFLRYARTDCPVVLCHTALIDSSNHTLGVFPWGLRTQEPVTVFAPGALTALSLRLGNVIGNPPNLFFHQRVRSHFIMDGRWKNSWDWQALLHAADTLSVMTINAPLVRFRDHQDSLSTQFRNSWVTPEEDLTIIGHYPFASQDARRASVWRQVLHLCAPLFRAVAARHEADAVVSARRLANFQAMLHAVFVGHEVGEDLAALMAFADDGDVVALARYLERPRSVLVQLAAKGIPVTWELITEIARPGSTRWSVVGNHPLIPFLGNVIGIYGDRVDGGDSTSGPHGIIVAGNSRMDDYLLWSRLTHDWPNLTVIRAFEWIL